MEVCRHAGGACPLHVAESQAFAAYAARLPIREPAKLSRTGLGGKGMEWRRLVASQLCPRQETGVGRRGYSQRSSVRLRPSGTLDRQGVIRWLLQRGLR